MVAARQDQQTASVVRTRLGPLVRRRNSRPGQRHDAEDGAAPQLSAIGGCPVTDR